MPQNEQYPNETDEEFEARMKLEQVANDFDLGEDDVETPDTSIIQPPSFGEAGITRVGGETQPSSLFGSAGGLEGAGGLGGGSSPIGARPRQTAEEVGSAQRAPARENPATQKPTEAPYRRKRADEVGIVANREERTRGRQKFAEEIGGAGGYDKLSDEQKDRGLELGLQERDITKFYNKKDDERRR